jgi:hypothetical protein
MSVITLISRKICDEYTYMECVGFFTVLIFILFCVQRILFHLQTHCDSLKCNKKGQNFNKTQIYFFFHIFRKFAKLKSKTFQVESKKIYMYKSSVE